MKKGLVMEGGAMRGMFTAGVIDVMMEHQITFDGAMGVSAGAVFGCNYKSSQPGRVIRYNAAYCNKPQYAGLRTFLKTGDMFGEQFCYHDIPEHLDPFDYETYRKNPMDFYVVVTDAKTGKALYKKVDRCDKKEMEWMRASASMPNVSKPVCVDGYELLDGGVADSIPVQKMQELGFDKTVVVLTQPRDYVKKKNQLTLKVLFCSGSSASSRAAAGSPRKSPASLSISSSSIRGFELLAVIMALMILPGMAPM